MIVTLIAATVAAAEPAVTVQPAAAPAPVAQKKDCCEDGCDCCKDMAAKDATAEKDGHPHQH